MKPGSTINVIKAEYKIDAEDGKPKLYYYCEVKNSDTKGGSKLKGTDKGWIYAGYVDMEISEYLGVDPTPEPPKPGPTPVPPTPEPTPVPPKPEPLREEEKKEEVDTPSPTLTTTPTNSNAAFKDDKGIKIESVDGLNNSSDAEILNNPALWQEVLGQYVAIKS